MNVGQPAATTARTPFDGENDKVERVRRQYDAVEPENRLVARSLERVWEERLRRVDQVEHEYSAWRREQAVC